MATLYRDWRPTAFDHAGLGLDDRQDWLVVPCMRTRDSGPLEESNFASALSMLGGESDTVEVHRFGHWGPGWFEVILAAPAHSETVEGIEGALESYPVLDDSDLSEREHEAAWEAWEMWGRRDYLRDMQRGLGLSDLACELIDEYVDADTLLRECERNESAYVSDSEVSFPNAMPSRDTVAGWLSVARPKWKAERRNGWAVRGILASMGAGK